MEVHGGLDVRRPSKKFKSPASISPSTSASDAAGGRRNLHLQAPSMRGSSRVFRISRRSTKRRPFGTSWMILRPATPWTGSFAATAAAAVLSGKQVAIAVPTTVLARQHVATFRKRFAPFNIEVGRLSRAASAAETREAKEGLKSGKLKVVVGTQALASKDVKFADLGLVIIDEEQHFGAAEKAKLSELAKGIHVLWMSATPIPRTLAAGLAGFRDLSVIASPPAHRLPVVTKVAPLSDAAIASALLREQRRHGQSFLICPRIQDLDPMLARLQSVAPDLRIVCLHGKLPVDEIDDRMMSFVEGATDVLLATNIVESGLDIPRANTIVVCWPERFGLAQLHQLRGRVGRGGIRAFAYLLTDSGAERSEKRGTCFRSVSPAMYRYSDPCSTATF